MLFKEIVDCIAQKSSQVHIFHSIHAAQRKWRHCGSAVHLTNGEIIATDECCKQEIVTQASGKKQTKTAEKELPGR